MHCNRITTAWQLIASAFHNSMQPAVQPACSVAINGRSLQLLIAVAIASTGCVACTGGHVWCSTGCVQCLLLQSCDGRCASFASHHIAQISHSMQHVKAQQFDVILRRYCTDEGMAGDSLQTECRTVRYARETALKIL